MKQHLVRTALIFIIRLFPAFASLVTLILFSRFTAPAFYGKYQSFWVQWQVLNTIACLGLPALIYTYPLSHITGFVRDLHPNYKKGFIVWIASVGVVFGLLQSMGSAPLFDSFDVTIFLISSAVITLTEAYLLLGRKYAVVAALSGIYAIFYILVHVLFVRKYLDVADLFDFLVSGNVVRLAILFFLSRKLFLKSQHEAFPLALKSVRSLWFHLGLYDLIQVLFRWIDKLLLGLLLSAPMFAIYFNGTIDVPFLPLLLGAAGNALLMQMSQHNMGDADRVDLIRESSATLSRIVFPVFFYLICFSRELFEVIFRNQYNASVPLFLISILVVPLRAYNFTSILQHKGKGRIINIGAALDLGIALILMYPLYRMFSLNGIALAFVLSTYFQAGFYLVHTARSLHVKWHQLLPLVNWAKQGFVFAAIFVGLYYLLYANFNSPFTLLLGSVALGIAVLLALLPILLSKRKIAHGPQV